MQQVLTVAKEIRHYGVKEILDEIKECVELLKAIGIEGMDKKSYTVKIGRMTNSFGKCGHKVGDLCNYTITISKYLVEGGSPEKLHNTIMHEVIHSVDGCHGHKGEWERVARMVNANYEYTPIKRTGSDEGFEAACEKATANRLQKQYVIYCDNCGVVARMQRRSRVVQLCEKGGCGCSCNRCGGTHFYVRVE